MHCGPQREIPTTVSKISVPDPAYLAVECHGQMIVLVGCPPRCLIKVTLSAGEVDHRLVHGAHDVTGIRNIDDRVT